MSEREPDRPTLESIWRFVRGKLPSALFREKWAETPYTNNQVPKYNSATGKFEPGTVGTGGIGGSVTTVKEAGAQVGDADIVTLDFGAGFDITESPDTEINIALDFSEAAPTHAQLGSVTADQHHTQSHDHSAAGDGTALVPASINDTGFLQLSGDESLSISANTHNWAVASTTSTVRLDVTAASKWLTGIAGGTDGRILIIHSIGAENISLRHENASSDAANRFTFAGGLAYTLAAGESIMLRYDATSSRWRSTGHSPVSASNVHTLTGQVLTGDQATDATLGHVKLATAAEVTTGTDPDKAITPVQLKAGHTDSADAHHAKSHDHTTADASGVLTNDEHDGYSAYTEIVAPGVAGANVLRVYSVDTGGVTALGLSNSAQEVILKLADWVDLTDGGASTLHSHHTIQDDDVNMTARANLSFQDGFVVTDDAGGGQTEIDVSYGAAGYPQNVSSTEADGTAITVARSDHVHAHEAAHIAHDTIWDAAGDLVRGSGADTASKLSKGTALQLLQVNSGATDIEWATRYSEHSYVFHSTVAWGEPIAAGVQKGYHHTGSQEETALEFTIHVDVACGTSWAASVIEISSGNDLDGSPTWAALSSVTLTMNTAKTLTVTGLSTAITADRLLRLNLGAITGTPPEDLTAVLRVKRKLL